MQLNQNLIRFIVISIQVICFALTIVGLAIPYDILSYVFRPLCILALIPFTVGGWNGPAPSGEPTRLIIPKQFKIWMIVSVVFAAIGNTFAVREVEHLYSLIIAMIANSLSVVCFIIATFPRFPLENKTSWSFTIFVLLCFVQAGHFMMYSFLRRNVGYSYVYWFFSLLQIAFLTGHMNTPESRRICHECHSIGTLGGLLLFFSNILRFLAQCGYGMVGEEFYVWTLTYLGLWMIQFSSGKFTCEKAYQKARDGYDSFDQAYVN
ncbi:uncharacterized protein MONOS_2958 [Monocercomonoides exilis]|uniref:uncharacterized protein n=1 Tax=Monocercomonoides exilis TaxID=2049356 RepID=UPI003559EE1E|nr:hypothetical protein MONOS_2958 [Monocercomonoides exilis]|eukprot:MONOS_2958.1-p1 / transcript=MONOS_2958.1 / gene=MONOS_2958 / organism=Monocercomonoides_exilis_PA203 / gene_product=unspecified product / transcript_product=unspecified product / location=Mono_scaffold00065:30798-31798(+) / protein_length=264 / sequence_SO=supercontig / SO=protein_coding / is_pseudo=false